MPVRSHTLRQISTSHKMASESIVPHVVPEVGGLEWPRFCYAGKTDLFLVTICIDMFYSDMR